MSAWESIGKCDDWQTPAYIFDALDIKFDLDVAAPKEGPLHVPALHWFYEQSLERDWGQGQVRRSSYYPLIWMNPPYGPRNGLAPWLAKFIMHRNGIALVPDRTSAPWFQGAAKRMDAVLFISPKVKFIKPDGTLGKSPGTGSVLFGIGARAIEAIKNADSLGWRARP